VRREREQFRVVIGAVVLAAGASSRFGSPKQSVLLEPVLAALSATALDEVVVVLGAHAVETDARTVVCLEWERGPGASLACGLEALSSATEAAVVVLADGPSLEPRAVERVIAAWRNGAGAVLAASYDGNRSHPVLLARDVWSRVPDEGARALDAILVDCADLDPPGDVDFADDLPGRVRPRIAE
jgi:CTP:molybdopterin cytidylyltransferase MocA